MILTCGIYSGCGGYCDNEIGAISTTGHGESITKVCLASRVINSMDRGKSPYLYLVQISGADYKNHLML